MTKQTDSQLVEKASDELNNLMQTSEVKESIDAFHLAIDNILESFGDVGIDEAIKAVFDCSNPELKDAIPDCEYSEIINSNKLTFIHRIYIRQIMQFYTATLPEQPVTVFPIELSRALKEELERTSFEDGGRLIKQLNENTKALIAVHYAE